VQEQIVRESAFLGPGLLHALGKPSAASSVRQDIPWRSC
jgi:hypothetical protein